MDLGDVIPFDHCLREAEASCNNIEDILRIARWQTLRRLAGYPSNWTTVEWMFRTGQLDPAIEDHNRKMDEQGRW